LSIF
jgi:hypothetical protein